MKVTRNYKVKENPIDAFMRTHQFVRCSPDCPYEDCIINIIEPPFQQESPGEGQGVPNPNANNTNNNPNNMAGQPNGNPSPGQAPGESDPSQSGQAPGGNQPGDAQSNQGGAPSPQSPDSPGGHQTQSNDPRPSPGGNEGQGAPKPERHSGPPHQPQQQPEQRPADNRPQEHRPGPGEVDKPTYKPVFQEKRPGPALPDGYQQGGHGAGMGDTFIQDLGRHNKREPVPSDVTFQSRLRNVMTDNAFDRRVKGRKRGKLDMKALYRVPMKAENVFTLKEARKNKDYNVILLIDQSGSMYNSSRHNPTYRREVDRIQALYDSGKVSLDKARGMLTEVEEGGRNIDVAAESATFLMESLDKIGVGYAVIGYSDKPKLHKSFDADVNKDNIKKLGYDLKHTGGGGTQLMPALVMSFELLKKQQHGTNIILCLSDGMPGESKQELIHYIRGHDRIADFVDIGINSKPVMDNGIIVKNLKDLKPQLLKELKARVKRG